MHNGHDSPAFKLAQGTGSHNANTVAYASFVFFVVSMDRSFSADFLFVEGVGHFIFVHHFERLIASFRTNDAEEFLAIVACLAFSHNINRLDIIICSLDREFFGQNSFDSSSFSTQSAKHVRFFNLTSLLSQSEIH